MDSIWIFFPWVLTVCSFWKSLAWGAKLDAFEIGRVFGTEQILLSFPSEGLRGAKEPFSSWPGVYSVVTVRKVWFRVELTPVPLQKWPWEQPWFHFSSCICHFQSLSQSHGSALTHCAEVPWSPEFSWVKRTLGSNLQQTNCQLCND